MLTELDLRGKDENQTRIALPRPLLDSGTDSALVVVREIIREVRERGDKALYEITERFDGCRLESLSIGRNEMKKALGEIPSSLKAALEKSAENVQEYYSKQLHGDFEITQDGMKIKSRAVPVTKAGCYVPGGRAAYPSTVIMTAVPAKMAGVDHVVIAVPPDQNGEIPKSVLAAAAISGVEKIHPIGGAQAIAALAYGTEEVDPVDVIVGPGNIYVSLAKQEVSSTVRVPSSFAGPSEVVVMADETAEPDLVAMDLVVQAEHGPNGLSWLITWKEEIAARVQAEIEKILVASRRKEEIESTLSNSGYCVLVEGPDQALIVSEAVAPEHLQLMIQESESMACRVRNAGAVFCGQWAPAVLGDYIAGPSHVLPTAGTARFAGALGVADFLKDIHVITASAETIQTVGEHVVTLASTEGLEAHSDSIRLRLEKIKGKQSE
ncbi:MAG: Histidinol dehydrogenase [Acidimicrobiales bacterium AG-410-I20]|nr:MAG: Histidinol dehydrogenase [Acidimicrobiales bacterium AG-410-I20]